MTRPCVAEDGYPPLPATGPAAAAVEAVREVLAGHKAYHNGASCTCADPRVEDYYDHLFGLLRAALASVGGSAAPGTATHDTDVLREAVVEWADKISRVAETAARYHQVDVAVPLRYAVDDLRRLAALGSGTAPTEDTP